MVPQVWSMFFAAVASLQYHPGAGRGEHTPLTIPQCAQIADAMTHQFMERFEKWQSPQH